jgi:hypothetical protein
MRTILEILNYKPLLLLKANDNIPHAGQQEGQDIAGKFQSEVFNPEEILKTSNIVFTNTENGEIKYIDYLATLPAKLAGTFTHVKFRIFSEQKVISPENQINLFFLCCDSPLIHVEAKATVAALMEIYGKDDLQQGIPDDREFESSVTGYWNGRNWSLNMSNVIWNMDNPEEESAYNITLSFENRKDGLCLCILCYDELMKMHRNAEK